MRAVRVHELGTPFKGEIAETPDPEPGPSEVVIQVRAAPVNFVDTIAISGRSGGPPIIP